MQLTDEAREQAIQQASRYSMAAHAAGDQVAARQHMDRMYELIRGRSDAQVAAMEADYFGWRGEQDRAHLMTKPREIAL